jgi:hypothetical protein
MSLAVVFKGPEGLVIAADSRVTLTAVQQQQQLQPEAGGGATATVETQVHHTYFDNASKLLSLQGHPKLGIVTYGQGSIGASQPRTAHGFMPEFEAHLDQQAENADAAALTVEEAAAELGKFFGQQWQSAGMPADADPMIFLVAGFDDGEAYGKVYEVSVPNAPEPTERIVNDFGVKWGGMPYLAERLIDGVAPRALQLAADELSLTAEQAQSLSQRWEADLKLPIPYQFLPLQDCVNMATFLVDMTATVMTWTVGVQGVGGDVDVATITRTDGFQSVRQKRISPWE